MPSPAAMCLKSSNERGPLASTACRHAFSSPIILPKSVRTAFCCVQVASTCRKHIQNTFKAATKNKIEVNAKNSAKRALRFQWNVPHIKSAQNHFVKINCTSLNAFKSANNAPNGSRLLDNL